MSEKMSEQDAVAEAWASIDGKLDKYILDRDTPGGVVEGGVPWGYYDGYQSDAAELIKRVAKRKRMNGMGWLAFGLFLGYLIGALSLPTIRAITGVIG